MALLPASHLKGLPRSLVQSTWSSSPVCPGSRLCVQQPSSSSGGVAATPQPAGAPSQRLLVAMAAQKKKPRFTDFDAQVFTDQDITALQSMSSMGSMDEVPGADKYADLIKQGRAQAQNQAQAQAQAQGQAQGQPAQASTKTAPAAGKKQNRQPAAFDFPPANTPANDDWSGFGTSNIDNWDLPPQGGYINSGNFQNVGGYQNGGGGGGGGGYYQNNNNGGGYYGGSGYMNGGGYMSGSGGMYGSYINNNNNARRAPGGRYDVRNGRNARNRQVANFLDDDELGWEEEEEAPEVRPDSVVVNGRPLQANLGITVPQVYLLASGPERKPLGVFPTAKALEMAREAKEDLLLITPDASPPVARIVDWSKYKYEQEKGLKEKKAKAVVIEIKEVRLRPTTDSGDLATKIKSCVKFLEKGNKVKLVMKFEGRELMFKDQGKDVLLRFIEDMGEMAKVEGPLNFKSATYNVLLAPNKATA